MREDREYYSRKSHEHSMMACVICFVALVILLLAVIIVHMVR